MFFIGFIVIISGRQVAIIRAFWILDTGQLEQPCQRIPPAFPEYPPLACPDHHDAKIDVLPHMNLWEYVSFLRIRFRVFKLNPNGFYFIRFHFNV